jgi:hypothetical protein
MPDPDATFTGANESTTGCTYGSEATAWSKLTVWFSKDTPQCGQAEKLSLS